MMFYNVTFVLLTRDKLKGISISFTFLCISLALLFISSYLPIILSPTNTSIFSNLYSCFTRSPSFSLLHHIILACPLPSIHNTPSLHPCLPKSLFNLILNTNTHTHTYICAHTHTDFGTSWLRFWTNRLRCRKSWLRRWTPASVAEQPDSIA